MVQSFGVQLDRQVDLACVKSEMPQIVRHHPKRETIAYFGVELSAGVKIGPRTFTVSGESMRDAKLGSNARRPGGVTKGVSKRHRLLEMLKCPVVHSLLTSNHPKDTQRGGLTTPIPTFAKDLE